MNSFSEGAATPLLSFWRGTLALAGVLLLSACSHDTTLPPFTASGYADNQGAVRIWRKDSGGEVHLLSAFSPWHNGNTSTAEYRWQGDDLSLIELNVYSKTPEHVKVRFEGACTGCSVNQMTLKAGVETTIKKYAPQIETVENVM